MNGEVIQNCSVCVVGGAGFLGSHLVNHLIDDRSCDVLVLDNLASGFRKFVHPKAQFEYCDITKSESFLLRLFRQYEVRYVFNYAASPYIPVSFERPLHVAEVNFSGALKVINAAQEAGCKRILQVSSAEIYGQSRITKAGENLQIDENYPVTPHSTYGASKAAVDAIVQVRWREANTPAIALRQFNCIGERETHPYVLPEIISQLHKKSRDARTVCIHLGNNSSRDFLYAGDAVRMAVELAEKGELGQVYNMGSQRAISVYGLAELTGKIMGFRNVDVYPDESRKRPWEIWSLQSNNSKLYEAISGRPTTTLEDAIRKTIDYYTENQCRWDWK